LKRISTVVVAGAFLAAALMNSVPVLASTQPTDPSVRPLCTGYVTANPSYQEDPVNTSAPITVDWYCEAPVHVVANVNWGDGNSDYYTCWSNCVNGSTGFSHVYVSRGYFYPSIYMTDGGSGGTSVTIYVY
jgi:aminoglycoside/choline kinase family phosphotransferase